MRRLNIKGDTIVEVLVSLAISGLLIVSGITASNQSLRGAQQSQERGEALKYVEAQAETLKRSAATLLGFAAGPSQSFCFNPANLTSVINLAIDPVVTSAAADPLSGYLGCTIGTDNRYHLVVYRTAADRHSFAVYARWPSIGSGANQELVIRYVVY